MPADTNLQPAGNNRKAKTILCIEDMLSNIALGKNHEKRPDYTLLTATQSGVGIELVKTHPCVSFLPELKDQSFFQLRIK
ncbi:MAG: hypothetical protein OEY29_14305 [Gammaproteobacteria bacterium]|nr:hypothetical protein [Gammaproteobacteria bacterium]